MPTSQEINEFLDFLENEFSSSGFVLAGVEREEAFPWIKRYAWTATWYVLHPETGEKAVPTERPQDGDLMFLVVRNFSDLHDATVEFECRCEPGRISFEGGDSEAILRAKILAASNPEGYPSPVDRWTRLHVSPEGPHAQPIRVISRTFPDESDASSKKNRTLVFQFD